MVKNNQITSRFEYAVVDLTPEFFDPEEWNDLTRARVSEWFSTMTDDEIRRERLRSCGLM